MPGAVGTNQLIDCVPSTLVGVRGGRVFGRFRNHLPPEETGNFVFLRPREIPIGDIEIGKTVVVEVPEIGAPRPAAHLYSSLAARVLKAPISGIAIECIAAVSGYVNIRQSVIVIIRHGHTHSPAFASEPRRLCDVRKFKVCVLVVERNHRIAALAIMVDG